MSLITKHRVSGLTKPKGTENVKYINCTMIQNCRLTVVNKEKESLEGRRFKVVSVNVFTRKGITEKKCMRLKERRCNKCKKCGKICTC